MILDNPEHNGHCLTNHVVDERMINKILAHLWCANFITQKLKLGCDNNSQNIIHIALALATKMY